MNVVLLWICGGLVAAVFGVMLYSVATFREVTHSRIGSRPLRVASEVFWALVPIAIFVLAAMPVIASMSEAGP